MQPSNIPQIVLISFDDDLNQRGYDIATHIIADFVNPNGSPIQATFFTNVRITDFWLAEKWYKSGNEIASHTMTHSTSTTTDVATWRKEIAGLRKVLSKYADIPHDAIKGFRAPFLMSNDAMYDVLLEQGFVYDSTHLECLGAFSPSETKRVWPYISNKGAPEACEDDACTLHLEGLFQIPVWGNIDSEGQACIATDPPASYDYDAVMELWQRNFNNRYHGNRAPMTLAMHATTTGSWLGNPNEPWRMDAVRDFITWAQSFDDVWFVSYSALIDFMHDPQSVDSILDFEPFVTSTLPFRSESEVITYRGYRFHSSAGLPDLPLKPDTLYARPKPVSGGEFSLTIDEYSSSIVVNVEITNNTDHVIHDWAWTFTLVGGEIGHMWNVDYTVGPAQIVVRPLRWLYPLHPGETLSFGFTALGESGSKIKVNPVSLKVFDLEPQKPRMTNIQSHDSQQMLLEWDDSGWGFKVETSTNGLDGPWTSGNAIYNARRWASPVLEDHRSVFFRIRRIE